MFSEGKEKLNFTLKRGQNQLFRYRVLIVDKALTPGRHGEAVPDLDRRSRPLTMHEPRMTKTHVSTTTRPFGALAVIGGAALAMALSVTATPAAQAPDAAAKPSTAVNAQELYKAKCQVCHMADGNSQIMPNMSFADGIWKHGATLKAVQTTIADGVAGTAMIAVEGTADAGRNHRAGEVRPQVRQEAEVGSAAMRIVSLLPSATEIVCALGLEPSLVGVTHECDFPPAVARLPKVTRTLIPHDAASAEIDALVRERLKTQLALYTLDLPTLETLAARPDRRPRPSATSARSPTPRCARRRARCPASRAS